MAFKTINDYNEEKFGGLFLLRNDGDYADVIFLYRDLNDVLIADTHYIKSADYSGYVHCTGRGCPACEKGIRVQTKLFIPLYNLTTGQIEFWDRNVRFENQLSADVFEKYPNPCEFVFRITRHGAAGDVNTTYQISVAGRNTTESYEDILNKFDIKMPDHYETICKDVDAVKLRDMISNNTTSSSYDSGSDIPSYQVTPRVSTVSSEDVVKDPIDEIPQFDDDDDDEDEIENVRF